MDGIKKALEPIVTKIGKDFEKCGPVVMIAQKTGLQPGHIVAAAFGVGVLLIITGIASNFVTALMGFLYPAYMSFKSLESEDDGDDMQWLTYWVVFIVIQFLDSVFGIFFSLIPLYFLAKLVLYVYLYYPKSKGAITVYQHLIRPLLMKYEKQIDDTLKKGEESLKNATEQIKEKIN